MDLVGVGEVTFDLTNQWLRLCAGSTDVIEEKSPR